MGVIIGGGGSGGRGTSDYEKLKNLPSINGQELKGNMELQGNITPEQYAAVEQATEMRRELTELASKVGDDVSNLSAKVDSSQFALGISGNSEPLEWLDGYRRLADLGIANATNYKRCIIHLLPGSVVRFVTNKSVTTISHATIVDSTANAIRTLLSVPSTNTPIDFTYHSDTECYIELCISASAINTTSVTVARSEAVGRITPRPPERTFRRGLMRLSELDWKGRYILDHGNYVGEQHSIITTQKISCESICGIRIMQTGQTASRAYGYRFSFFDEDGQYIINSMLTITDVGEFVNFYHAGYVAISITCHALTGDVSNFNLDDVAIDVLTSESSFIGGKSFMTESFSWKPIANTTYSGWKQGCDNYGNILVQFYKQHRSSGESVRPFNGAEIIDLNTGKTLQLIDLPLYDDIHVHNNSVCFGIERYSPSDAFPLLYTCDMFLSRDIRVWRLQEVDGEYSLTQVQVIHPIGQDVYGELNPSSYIDKRGYLWTMGTHLNDTDNGVYVKYRLPSITEGAEVTLTESDVIDHFLLPITYVRNGVTTGGAHQDGTIVDGILYQGYGFGSENGLTNWLSAIDLDAKSIIKQCRLNHAGLDSEIEGVFYWNGKLGVSFNLLRGLVVSIGFH